jgi:hypothetical protein
MVDVTQADRDCTRDVINALHLGIGGVSEIVARYREAAIADLTRQRDALKAELSRRDANEARNCINWGRCSLHNGKMGQL